MRFVIYEIILSILVDICDQMNFNIWLHSKIKVQAYGKTVFCLEWDEQEWRPLDDQVKETDKEIVWAAVRENWVIILRYWKPVRFWAGKGCNLMYSLKELLWVTGGMCYRKTRFVQETHWANFCDVVYFLQYAHLQVGIMKKFHKSLLIVFLALKTNYKNKSMEI